MPPKSEPLRREHIQILRAWIDQGANWPETAAAWPAGRPEMVVTKEDRQHIMAVYGFNEPLWKQYLRFNRQIFTGQFGIRNGVTAHEGAGTCFVLSLALATRASA